MLEGGLLVVLLVILLVILGVKSCRANSPATDETAAEPGSEIIAMPEGHITVNGISLDGLSFEESVAAITAPHSWSMTAVLGENTVPVSNLIEIRTRRLLEDICLNSENGTYTFDFTSGMEELAAEEAAALAERLNVNPQNSTLDHFDVQTGKFVFTQGKNGLTVDQEKLSAALTGALAQSQYDAVIQAEASETPAESDAEVQARYKTLASFTTTTTNNSKRNTNVKLSADAINGTVVQPGEEFSFNAVVGQRTAEKGYQAAAAYNSGEVVQELGGGVCQISSTLYRVAFQAGMEITYRRSHTFEPNYVTPGQDATISWDLPDFRFVNTSEGAIGVRASYSNQKASVSIYGIPVLEDGVVWDLYSEKVAELDPPEPTYIEDATLDPGTEKLEKSGSQGSTWVTYKVVLKDGVEIERVKDHEKTYKGHAPVIRRNTGTVKLDPDETESPAETPSPTVDGMPEDYVPGQEDEEGTSRENTGSGTSSGDSQNNSGHSSGAETSTGASRETDAASSRESSGGSSRETSASSSKETGAASTREPQEKETSAASQEAGGPAQANPGTNPAENSPAAPIPAPKAPIQEDGQPEDNQVIPTIEPFQ